MPRTAAGWRWLLWFVCLAAGETFGQSGPGTPGATPAVASSPAGVQPPDATPPSPAPPPSALPLRSPAQLEQLAAPLALYPDALIASILPASVYPLEIVQAARFVADTNNLPRLEAQPWDANVKAVARLPVVIQQMNVNLDWTVQLGQAFLAQPLDLMNSVQALRAKARTAGTLKTTPEQVVLVTNAIVERTYEGQVVYVTNTVIQVQPATTNVIYVPSYNPSVVYVDDDDDAAALVSFGVGMAMGAVIWGNCDWHYGGCYWGHYPPPPPFPPPYRPPPGARPPPPGTRPPGMMPPGSRPPGAQPPGARPPNTRPPGSPPNGVQSRPATPGTSQRWQPDPARLGQSGARTPSAGSLESRGWSAGASRAASLPATGARPGSGNLARPTPATGLTRPATAMPANGRSAVSTPTGARAPVAGTSAARPNAPMQPSNRVAPTRPSGSSAFSGMNSGAGARNLSTRGSFSRGGGGGRAGGGRR